MITPRFQQVVAADGYISWSRVWPAAGTLRGRVIVLHGIISHGGWYGASCQALAEAGFEVHFLDRRGSGVNTESRGDVDRYTTWISDVVSYLETQPADAPRILLGISWGGKLAAAVAKARPDLLAGLGLLCPGIHAQRGARPFQQRLLRIAAALGLKRRLVTVPLKEADLFTNVYRLQQYINADPLVLRRITIGFALEDLELSRLAAASAENISTPTLLVLAGRDRIIDNPRMRGFFARLPGSRNRLIEYPEAAHTFDFEPDPRQYFRDLTAWCSSIVAG